MTGFAPGGQREAEKPFVARGEVEFRGFTEDDGVPCQIEVVGAPHAVAAGFFADHEEEGHIVGGDGLGGEEFLQGNDLGGDAGFGVDAAATPDFIMVSDFIGVEGGDGVDVTGQEDAALPRLAGIGEDVVSWGCSVRRVGQGLEGFNGLLLDGEIVGCEIRR